MALNRKSESFKKEEIRIIGKYESEIVGLESSRIQVLPLPDHTDFSLGITKVYKRVRILKFTLFLVDRGCWANDGSGKWFKHTSGVAGGSKCGMPAGICPFLMRGS